MAPAWLLKDSNLFFIQVDCGASPGSWMQVALQRIKCNKNKNSGIVIAVDLLEIKDIPGCITLSSCDFTHSDVQQRIMQFLPHGQADVVMSDMAPLSTGNKKLDHSKIIDLNRAALEFARTVLSNGGCFLCKLWDGNETGEFIEEISESFSLCKQVKPKASRVDSSELYIFSKGFIKNENITKKRTRK
ncbi:rRNA methyltransferase 2, mitochondrial-like [Paramuricea clavata]|uniref:rRNA methyltransferase 2, mitochondrial n=1 Tax=Paramuricea clavata TaxID=317549 RepID=A0A6S7HUE9_PARCT|nr:rRNA methyltransferase 2, mitochondrial-like [Paramuricea clavata]